MNFQGVKWFLLIFLFVILPRSTIEIQASGPDGASSILQRASFRCSQAGGMVNTKWDAIVGEVDKFGELITNERYAYGPSCWCGVIPVHVLRFNSCKLYFIIQLISFGVILGLLALIIRKRNERQIRA